MIFTFLNDMKLKCEMCDQGFTHKGALKLHQYNVHNGMEFECHVCKQVYKRKHTLNEHFKARHDDKAEKVKCDLCDKSFINTGSKNKHMKNVHWKNK